MNTPYVEFDTKQLKNNYLQMKLRCPNVQFIFPVKCCTNERVLEVLADCADGFDISNEAEYDIIAAFSKSKLLCGSGPFSHWLIEKESVLVASNSKNVWKKGCGIRINFNDDDRFQKSHFGVTLSDLSKELCEEIRYLHFHCSDDRNQGIREAVYEKVRAIINMFPHLEFLNVGGHLTRLTIDEAASYINEIRFLVPNDISLIVEAGDFFVGNCGTLWCEVVDSILNKRTQTVFVNLSKEAHLRWSYPHLTSDYYRTNDTVYRTFIYGVSCCENDLVYTGPCRRLKIGEILNFNNITSYSAEWNQRFNGLEKIKVIIL